MPRFFVLLSFCMSVFFCVANVNCRDIKEQEGEQTGSEQDQAQAPDYRNVNYAFPHLFSEDTVKVLTKGAILKAEVGTVGLWERTCPSGNPRIDSYGLPPIWANMPDGRVSVVIDNNNPERTMYVPLSAGEQLFAYSPNDIDIHGCSRVIPAADVFDLFQIQGVDYYRLNPNFVPIIWSAHVPLESANATVHNLPMSLLLENGLSINQAIEQIHVRQGTSEPTCSGCVPVEVQGKIVNLQPLAQIQYSKLGSAFNPGSFVLESTLENLDPVFLVPWAHGGCPISVSGCRLMMSVPKVVIGGLTYYDTTAQDFMVVTQSQPQPAQ